MRNYRLRETIITLKKRKGERKTMEDKFGYHEDPVNGGWHNKSEDNKRTSAVIGYSEYTAR